MEITINTINDCCESVDINCSSAEWLIIHKALKRLAEDENAHPNNRVKATSMADSEVQIYRMD